MMEISLEVTHRVARGVQLLSPGLGRRAERGNRTRPPRHLHHAGVLTGDEHDGIEA